MRSRSTHFVLLLALALGGNSVYGQGSSGAGPKRARTPDDYKPRTLKELAAEGDGGQGLGNKEETMVVHGRILPSRVRAAYAGTTRPLPPIKREVLRQWARLYAGSPEGYTEPYQTEALFIEDGAEHWLAVRKRDLPRLRQGLKKGEAADLYLIRVGAAKAGGGWELVLLVESFRKPN